MGKKNEEEKSIDLGGYSEVVLKHHDVLNEDGTSILFEVDPVKIRLRDTRVRIKKIVVDYALDADEFLEGKQL